MGRWTRFFASVDHQPLATGSLAQVHCATGHNGQQYALKALRPRIRPELSADIAILSRFTCLMELSVPGQGFRTFGAVVEEFADQVMGELDLEQELQALASFQDQLGPDCHAPRPCPELSSPDVLAMAYCEGLPFTALAGASPHNAVARLEAAAPGTDLDDIAERFAIGCLTQFFHYGRFHADPHPGNVLVRSDGGWSFSTSAWWGISNRPI